MTIRKPASRYNQVAARKRNVAADKRIAEQHAQRIRQLEFMLEKADYGMGMPRDYQRVLELRASDGVET